MGEIMTTDEFAEWFHGRERSDGHPPQDVLVVLEAQGKPTVGQFLQSAQVFSPEKID